VTWFARTVAVMSLTAVWWLPLAWWETIILAVLMIFVFVTIGVDLEEEE
jgi:hypothetical protein